MWSFLLIVFFIGFVLMLIWGVVSVVRRTGKVKNRFLYCGLFFILMIAASAADDLNTAAENPSSPAAEHVADLSPSNDSGSEALMKMVEEEAAAKPEDMDAEDEEADTENAEETRPAETISQRNAVMSARLYLDSAPFSRKGLIEQLEFEGYSASDAEYAVDALDVDWNEQAAKSAEIYLSTMPFSQQGLIDQLTFEGFTSEQAEFGVEAAMKKAEEEISAEPEDGGPAETASQRNAIMSAKLYLDTAPFSRKGLIEQLEFEGYSASDAEYAVDALDADWNEQAAKIADLYLSTMSFSKKELIDQLIFDGFTREQAEFGVNQAYK